MPCICIKFYEELILLVKNIIQMSGSETNLMVFLMVGLIVFFIYNCHNKQSQQSQKIQTNVYDNDDDDNENFESMGGSKDKSKKKKKKKKNNNKQHKKNKKYELKINNLCNIINGKSSPVGHSRNNDECIKRNNDFVEMQYHKDYNDTITAINNLTPQKELFNMGFLPVKESTPDENNVMDLVELFMEKVNGEVKNNVSEYLHTNSGWSDMGKRRREKSGFEQTMEELGLPGSLYNESAAKAPIKLVAIDKAEQFNTDDQIRFIIYLIVQKENVKDQMVLKVHFFMEKEDLKSGGDSQRDFFEKNLEDAVKNSNEKNQLAIIEQIFTVGYLTNDSEKKTKMNKFHDYSNIKKSDGTMDQEKVIKLMLRKHKDRADELNSFLCTVDDGTKEIHDVPGINSYSQYANTRTIMDDLAQFPQHSFGDVPI